MHCIHSVYWYTFVARVEDWMMDDLAASPIVRIREFDSRQDNVFYYRSVVESVGT